MIKNTLSYTEGEQHRFYPWYNHVEAISSKYDIDPKLVKAIIEVESSNEVYAVRHEPYFRWLYNVEDYTGLQTTATEETMQKTSWGLMQIMGATARELGFEGRFLVELINPETNIEYGCKYLAGLRDRFQHLDSQIAIFDDNKVAAYNAGSPRRENGEFVNQDYVDKIIQAWES